MARMGQIMAAIITGMRDILMTRAALKSEMRMDRTMINAGGNNPLKFSVSAEQAIEAMIRPSVKAIWRLTRLSPKRSTTSRHTKLQRCPAWKLR